MDGVADDAPGRDWFTNFSDWGAAGVAHLTTHGEAVVQRMGEYYRSVLVGEARRICQRRRLKNFGINSGNLHSATNGPPLNGPP